MGGWSDPAIPIMLPCLLRPPAFLILLSRRAFFVGEPLGSPPACKREAAGADSAKRRMRASRARKVTEGILAVSAILYLWGLVLAPLWR